jgi:transcriptional regulator with XRE-family HTH domain
MGNKSQHVINPKLLKYFRLRTSYTQEDVANLIDKKSYLSIQNWETGKLKIPNILIPEICGIYNIPPDDLIKGMPIIYKDNKETEYILGVITPKGELYSSVISLKFKKSNNRQITHQASTTNSDFISVELLQNNDLSDLFLVKLLNLRTNKDITQKGLSILDEISCFYTNNEFSTNDNFPKITTLNEPNIDKITQIINEIGDIFNPCFYFTIKFSNTFFNHINLLILVKKSIYFEQYIYAAYQVLLKYYKNISLQEISQYVLYRIENYLNNPEITIDFTKIDVESIISFTKNTKFTVITPKDKERTDTINWIINEVENMSDITLGRLQCYIELLNKK